MQLLYLNLCLSKAYTGVHVTMSSVSSINGNAQRVTAEGRTPLMQPSIGTCVFLPMFKARFEAFWTPFKIFSDIQSVGNSLNFNIYFNVGVVFRLVFELRTFKQRPPYFGPVFKPQNAILAMSPSEGLLF